MATARWHQWPDLSDVLTLWKAKMNPSLPLSKLSLSDKAKEALHTHIDTVGLDSWRFDHSANDQCTAYKLLGSIGLYIPDELFCDVHSKYALSSTDRKPVKAKISSAIYTRCTRIYQCLRGTDHRAGKRPSKDRYIGWEDVGCVSWIKLVSMHDETDKNKRFGDAPGDIHYRLVLNNHETTSLYHTHFAGFGIPQCSAAEENLDKWFHINSPSPLDPALSDTCLYYKACGDDQSDWFIIIISTPEQQSMAWHYGHKRLILFDGTFGINSAQSLLFIGMAINHENKCIPIVFFHFTAWKTSAATHGDYDRPLLQDLLNRWKQAMGKNDAGEDFEIKVILTNDNT
ncbi:hypothetical protein BDR04DRAFT_1163528 [Suillus decipiens]|nr:hypothetical protein BDR04DRAFT_1163528 [Suillus decipiens]